MKALELVGREHGDERHHGDSDRHATGFDGGFEHVLFTARLVDQIHHEKRNREQGEEPEGDRVLGSPGQRPEATEHREGRVQTLGAEEDPRQAHQVEDHNPRDPRPQGEQRRGRAFSSDF